MNPNNNNNILEPRRDLPIHKIPELLAKITGTISSTISSSSFECRTISSIDWREIIFENYSDRNGLMTVDGILRWCNDLNLEPDSYEVLLFCFLCRAKQMYLLTRDEFIQGLKNLGQHVHHNLTEIRQALLSYNVVPYENEFYQWTFLYGLVDGQRCLTTPNAISLWRLFYSKQVQQPLIINQWLNYLNDDIVNDIPKTITGDTWKIFPQFSKFIETHGYDTYDDNEAWPALFDGFVEFQRKLDATSSSIREKGKQ